MALIDAVAAGCAVPMVWPVVTIDGRRYMNGGMWSETNIPLAKDCDRVIVLAPETLGVTRGLGSIDATTRSLAISPDTPPGEQKDGTRSTPPAAVP